MSPPSTFRLIPFPKERAAGPAAGDEFVPKPPVELAPLEGEPLPPRRGPWFVLPILSLCLGIAVLASVHFVARPLTGDKTAKPQGDLAGAKPFPEIWRAWRDIERQPARTAERADEPSIVERRAADAATDRPAGVTAAAAPDGGAGPTETGKPVAVLPPVPSTGRFDPAESGIQRESAEVEKGPVRRSPPPALPRLALIDLPPTPPAAPAVVTEALPGWWVSRAIGTALRVPLPVGEMAAGATLASQAATDTPADPAAPARTATADERASLAAGAPAQNAVGTAAGDVGRSLRANDEARPQDTAADAAPGAKPAGLAEAPAGIGLTSAAISGSRAVASSRETTGTTVQNAMRHDPERTETEAGQSRRLVKQATRRHPASPELLPSPPPFWPEQAFIGLLRHSP